MNRVGNPLEWSVVDKTLLCLGVVLVLNIPFTLFIHLTARMPGFTPAFFNRSMFLLGVKPQWGFVFFFAFLFVIGWVLRRTDPENRWLPYGCAISIGIHDAWFMVGVGHATNSSTFLTLFLVFFIGLLFFDLRFAILVCASWVLVQGAGIVAEQVGLMPYAPALVHSPHMNGRIDPWWMLVSMVIGGLLTALMLVLFGYVLSRWRKREKEVNELSEFLKKIFGRYLSTVRQWGRTLNQDKTNDAFSGVGKRNPV